MSKQKIEQQIESNRNQIDKILNSDLPLDLVYFNIRILAKMNEKLIKKLNDL